MSQDADITPEGIKVQVGQKWRDLDKRNTNRICTIVGLELGTMRPSVLMGNPRYPNMKATRVQVRRLKKGSTGWTLVPAE